MGSNGFMEMKGSKDYLSQLSFPNLIVHVLVHVFSKMFSLEIAVWMYMGVAGKRLSRHISNISVNLYVHENFASKKNKSWILYKIDSTWQLSSPVTDLQR